MMQSPSRPALPLPPSAEGHMTRRAFEHLKSSCDAEALLRRAGLTLPGIDDPQARIGAESQIAFLKLATEALDDPLLGFHLAENSSRASWACSITCKPHRPPSVRPWGASLATAQLRTRVWRQSACVEAR